MFSLRNAERIGNVLKIQAWTKKYILWKSFSNLKLSLGLSIHNARTGFYRTQNVLSWILCHHWLFRSWILIMRNCDALAKKRQGCRGMLASKKLGLVTFSFHRSWPNNWVKCFFKWKYCIEIYFFLFVNYAYAKPADRVFRNG